MIEPNAGTPSMGMGLAGLEAEHAIQFKLLAEVERAVAAGDDSAARAVIHQLYEYSEAHFGSEQVLMRLYAYPGYQAHEREHGDLLVALGNMLAALANGDDSGAPDAIRRWLTAHIQHADQAFVDFVSEGASRKQQAC